jgi:hypothetical protein
LVKQKRSRTDAHVKWMEPQEIIPNNTDIITETTNADKTAIAADLEQRILNSKKRKAERKEKKAQKKAKYMETISTKNAKEGQTVGDQPDPNSFFDLSILFEEKGSIL